MIKPRILIVDDEKEIRDSFAAYLAARLNCDVAVQSNGRDAIEALDREEFHVLLQDIRMPGIDGYTVIRHVKRHRPGIIVFVVTKLDGLSDIQQVEKLGGIYVPKPVELKTVLRLIERELEKTGGFDYKK